MGSHHKSLFIFLLISCIAQVLVYPACCEVLPGKEIRQHYVSYTPRPQDFPNEQLYRAYLVIQQFKNTITSDPKNATATWIGHDICGEKTYVGFYCGTPEGADKLTVTAVILNGFRLHAPKLQGFVDQLPDLAFFHAASNDFGGDIPRLAGLGYMYELNVRDDNSAQTTGDSDEAGGKVDGHGYFHYGCLTTRINIKFNIGMGRGSKRGSMIPAGVTDGKALLLNYNNLSGQLPANIGLSKLSYLSLANNKLTGPIPPSIAQLQDSLLEVLLLNNQLSGCLPQELGLLTKAAVIDAGMNQLTGPIPSSFSCLRRVEQLNLGGNRLNGEVPDALCKLAAGPAGRLSNLTLSSNYFTSVGPACSSLIKDGVLDVKNNCIPGFAGQRPAAQCAAFLNRPKTCPPAASTQVACPAADGNTVAAPEGSRVPKDYSSYVTYATLHE